MSVSVSVVIVSYNQEKYISKAIESVLTQKTDFPVEILVGDDCSSDRTPEIIQGYVDRYPDKIKFIRRSSNVGATYNAYDLNTRCEGDYIAYLEGDDYWTDPLKLQKQKDFLDRHTEFHSCAGRFQCVDENGNTTRALIEWYKPRKHFSLRDFDGYHLPSQSSTYLRRNIYKEPKFDYSVMYKTNPMIGDRISILVYLMHGDLYCFDEKMTAYRLPQGRKETGTSRVYSDKKNALRTDTEIFLAQRELSLQHNLKLSLDYMARRIFYSAVFGYLKTGDKDYKNHAKKMLEFVESKMKTYFFAVPYCIKKFFRKAVSVLMKFAGGKRR